MSLPEPGLPAGGAFAKRLFDLLVAAAGLLLLWWLILLAALAATVDTGRCGFFVQTRIGRHGRPFRLVKLRTMKPDCASTSTVTTREDARVTRLGWLLRRLKLDELPQLWNVLLGHMSLVGPRPDVPGFADRLEGDDRAVLALRPGITGPATLRYRNEEELLASVADPEEYNRSVIYPEKVRLNIEYLRNWSFARDLRYIWWTLTSKNLQ